MNNRRNSTDSGLQEDENGPMTMRLDIRGGGMQIQKVLEHSMHVCVTNIYTTCICSYLN